MAHTHTHRRQSKNTLVYRKSLIIASSSYARLLLMVGPPFHVCLQITNSHFNRFPPVITRLNLQITHRVKCRTSLFSFFFLFYSYNHRVGYRRRQPCRALHMYFTLWCVRYCSQSLVDGKQEESSQANPFHV